MKQSLFVWVLGCAIIVGAAGCSINLGNRAGGDGSTLGKELMDLKEARDRGVVSDAEYEEQRRALLNRHERDH